MSHQSHFEMRRWVYFFLFWLVVMSVGVTATEYVIGPSMQRIFDDGGPYQWPTWSVIVRMALLNLFMGFFGGTVCWFYDKKSSGR
jgi:hypothetical protein